MYINFETLQEHLNKFGCVVNISIDTDDNILKFTLGKVKDYGSRVELIEPYDLMEILTLNQVIGEGGSVQAILKRSSRTEEDAEQIEELIYGTLAKYITRLFYSSIAPNPFPEIKWLKKDAHHYVAE